MAAAFSTPAVAELLLSACSEDGELHGQAACGNIDLIIIFGCRETASAYARKAQFHSTRLLEGKCVLLENTGFREDDDAFFYIQPRP